MKKMTLKLVETPSLRSLMLPIPIILLLSTPAMAFSVHGAVFSASKAAARGAAKVVKAGAKGVVAVVKHI